jgi:hypothetical protein
MTRMLNRLQSSGVWRAFRQWRQYTEQEHIASVRRSMHTETDRLKGLLRQEKTKRVTNLLQRWRMHSLVPVFKAWYTYTRDHRTHKRDVMSRMLKRLESSGVWRAWRTWKHFIEYDKVNELKSSLMDQNNRLRSSLLTEKGRRINALINRWRSHSLISVFQSWHQYAIVNKRQRQSTISRIISRIGQLHQWRAWHQWLHYNEQHRVHQLRLTLSGHIGELRATVAAERQKRAQAMITRWRTSCEATAFEAWRHLVANRRRDRHHRNDTLARICKRLILNGQYRALRQWRYYVISSSVNDVRQRATHADTERQRLISELAINKRARADDVSRYQRRETLIPCFYKWRRYVRSNRTWKAKRAAIANGHGAAHANGDLDTTLRQHWSEDEILDVYWKYLGVRYTRFQ